MQWLAVAATVALVVSWLIAKIGFLFLLALALWCWVALQVLARITPMATLTSWLAKIVAPVPVKTGPPRQPTSTLPAVTSTPSARSAPNLSPQQALKKGQAAIEKLHGLGVVNQALQDLFASQKATSASVRRGTLIVLEGAPGTGKTTVAANLALMLYGTGQIKDPDPWSIEADEATAIPSGQLFDAMRQVAHQNLGRALIFRHADWLGEESAGAVGRAMSWIVDKFKEPMVVILTGSIGLSDRIAHNPGLSSDWLGRFSRRTARFPQTTHSTISAILSDLARDHGVRFDDESARMLAARLAELSQTEGYENAVTVHSLFDDALGQASKRADALGQRLTLVSSADAAAAIDLFHR